MRTYNKRSPIFKEYILYAWEGYLSSPTLRVLKELACTHYAMRYNSPRGKHDHVLQRPRNRENLSRKLCMQTPARPPATGLRQAAPIAPCSNPRLSLKWLLYKKIAPVHPGEILLADVLEPLGSESFREFFGGSAEPGKRHRSLSAQHHGRYIRAVGPMLGDERRVLAGLTGAI